MIINTLISSTFGLAGTIVKSIAVLGGLTFIGVGGIAASACLTKPTNDSLYEEIKKNETILDSIGTRCRVCDYVFLKEAVCTQPTKFNEETQYIGIYNTWIKIN